MPANWMRRKATRGLALGLGAVVLIGAGGYSAWIRLPAEHTCRSCHEIGPSYDTWITSAHRGMRCTDCHGTATSNGLHSLREKARMVLVHFSGATPAKIRVREEQALDIMQRCTGCHRSQYADWLRSGHSATYASIFLNEKHNREEKLHPDCLKCHGMFFDGGIEDLVAPLDRKGPWKLKLQDHAQLPVIPCLTCHEIHSRGETAVRPDYAAPREIPSKRKETPSPLVWYDRYNGMHLRGEFLVARALKDGGRPVQVAKDDRQRVCGACHAPDPHGEVGTSDDRTPKGVHEGIACLACHGAHSQETRRSCGGCHPAISNCGRDVTQMDTTFKDPASKHNIHFVKCSDCHPKGIPARKSARTVRTD